MRAGTVHEGPPFVAGLPPRRSPKRWGSVALGEEGPMVSGRAARDHTGGVTWGPVDRFSTLGAALAWTLNKVYPAKGV